MPSIEYRSHVKDEQKFWTALDFLYDKDVVRFDHQDSVDDKDGKIRTNEMRYWFRSMGNGDVLESNWNYKFNLDYVSDQNFLREYQNRMTGFDNSREASYEMFGRDFAELDQNRVSEGYVYRNWERLTLTGGLRFEQDPSLGNGNESYSTDDTVQRLPELYAFWNKGKLVEGLPFDLGGYARTGYMLRQEGVSGFRSELYPQLSLPIDLRYASMEISTGVRATLYNNNSEKNSPAKKVQNSQKIQDNASKIVPEFGVDFYTQATKTWEWPQRLELTQKNLGKTQYTGLRHFLQPRVSYSWVDDINQEDVPFYMSEDRIQDGNSVVFSLDNHFTFRQSTVAKDKEGLTHKTSYKDLMRIKFSGGYDFREANRKQHRDILENRPWHDIRLGFRMTPMSWLALDTDAYYSFYEGEVSRLDNTITLSHPRYGSFSSEYSVRTSSYDYRDISSFSDIASLTAASPLDVITNTLILNLTPEIHIFASDKTDLEDGTSLESSLGVGILHQCLRVFFEYTRDAQEERLDLNVEIIGLGF